VALKGFTGDVTSCCFSPDGKIFVASSNDKSLRVYKTENLYHEKSPAYNKINVGDNVASISFSADSHHVILGTAFSQEVVAFKFNEKKDESGKVYKEAMRFPTKFSFGLKNTIISNNSKIIVTSADETAIKIFSLKGALLETLNTSQVKNNMVALSNDSKFIAAATWGAEVKVWEIKYKKENNDYEKAVKAFDLKNHKNSVYAVCFSSDSKKMATTSKDNTWKLWDINIRYHINEDAHVLLSVPSPNPSVPLGLISMSPDSKYIAITSAENLYIYASNGTLLTTIPAHKATIVTLIWSPDSKYLVTGGDTSIRFWNTPK